MRYKKLIAALVAAMFLLGVCMPALAGDGTKPIPIDPRLEDHPWQDENTKGGTKKVDDSSALLTRPIIVTVVAVIPVLGNVTKMLAPSDKTVDPKRVEKRK